MNDLITIQKIAGWEKLKTLVLDSVSSPITKRLYNMALDEFLGWFQQAPRPGFTKATVSAWRVSLEARGLGSSSIIIRMSAIRKLAAEAYGDPSGRAHLRPRAATGCFRSLGPFLCACDGRNILTHAQWAGRRGGAPLGGFPAPELPEKRTGDVQ